jgi:hypothetical protein
MSTDNILMCMCEVQNGVLRRRFANGCLCESWNVWLTLLSKHHWRTCGAESGYKRKQGKSVVRKGTKNCHNFFWIHNRSATLTNIGIYPSLGSGIANWLWLDDWVGWTFFSPLRCPRRLWGSLSLLSNRYRRFFPLGAKRREPPAIAGVKKCGTIHQLAHTPSWHSA